MAPLPPTHPDGDPFEAQDRERESKTLLGKWQQRAELENPQLHSASSPTTTNDKSNSKSGGKTVLNVGKDGTEVMVIGSTDSEGEGSEGEAQMTDPDDDDDDASDREQEEEEGEGVEAGENEEEEEEGSGEEEEGDVSRMQTDGGKDEEDDDEEDSEEDDDSEDDDSDSVASGSPGEGGDVSMMTIDGQPSPSKPKSPVKSQTVIGPDGQPIEVPVLEGLDENGQPKKEKKKRRRRALGRSPSPPPLVPKPPPPTVRLEFTLPPRNSAETPEFNVIGIAREKGILPPVEPKKDEKEDSEGEGQDSESDGQGGRRKKVVVSDKGKERADSNDPSAPPKKKRKRGPNVILGRFGGYDTNDPFVDDTEIALYEPRHYHRPKEEGYFVCIGEVECAPRRGRVKGSKNLKKDENGNLVPINAPAPRRQSKKFVVGPDGKPISIDTPQAGPSSSSHPHTGKLETPFGSVGATFGGGNGAAASPIVNSVFGAPTPSTVVPAKPVRKPGEFSEELKQDLEMLKTESDKESYEVKNKFPPALKDLLVAVSYHALDLGEFDDYFFSALPGIFPYNKFTLTKLVKRECFQKRISDWTMKQDEYLDQLKQGIEENYEPQRAEFLEMVKIYEQDKEERENGGGGSTTANGQDRAKTPPPLAAAIPAFGAAPPSAHATPGGSPAVHPETDGANGDDNKEPTEPKWKFRFNEPMRAALYYACDCEDKKSELTIEKQTLEKSTTREHNREKPHNAKAARKAIYQKVLELWPADMMTTNQISREISNFKLKLKKHGEIE